MIAWVDPNGIFSTRPMYRRAALGLESKAFQEIFVMRIRCTKAVICLGILAILVAMSPAAFSGIVTSTKDLPPDGVYIGLEVHELYEGAALDFMLSLPIHKPYANDPVHPVDRVRDNDDEVEYFNSGLTAVLQVTQKDGTVVLPATDIYLEGMVETRVKDYYLATEAGLGTFDTEIVAMSLSMDNPMSPGTLISVEILPSPGHVSVVELPDGTFQIDSFFDVFTRLSIDTGNGLEVIPGSSIVSGVGSHMELIPDPTIPEPGTITLLAFAGLALLGYSWRRKRAA